MSLLFALAKTHNCLIYILLPISSPKKEVITRPDHYGPVPAITPPPKPANQLRASELLWDTPKGVMGKQETDSVQMKGGKKVPLCVCVCVW